MPNGNHRRCISQDALVRKRSQLGSVVGNPNSDLEVVEGGFESFVQHFSNGWDIYFSAGDSEAHEVHGEIKHKYDTIAPVPVKSTFGLPITDESPAANGGRFNDFQGGKSIYWHPDIGPRVISGPIRDSWKQQGGEGGPLGYPVKDLRRWPTANRKYHVNTTGRGMGDVTGFKKTVLLNLSGRPSNEVAVRRVFEWSESQDGKEHRGTTGKDRS
jgi:hypothetical protein